MIYKNTVTGLAALFWITSINAQVISEYLTQVIYNTDVDHINSASISIFYNHVMIDDIFSDVVSTDSPDIISSIRGAHVDGYHKDNNGIRYFSFDSDTKVNDTNVLKSDILRCDNPSCSLVSLFFDSNINNLKHLNINAFTLNPESGELLFSIDSAGRIGAREFFPGDIIRLTSEGDYYLEYDSDFPSGNFLQYKNIDGLTLLPNNHYIVSLANEEIYHTIYDYYPPTNTWGLAYTPLHFGEAYARVNITSLMAFENDLIFKNGFN